MRLGLLADIHEEADLLRDALARLRRLGVDRFVVLGDVADHGLRLDETAALLDEAGAGGVWGNHDAGFCLGGCLDELRARFQPRTIDYMGGLLPRLEIDGCLFSHIEPCLDPTALEDLWGHADPPDAPGRADLSFAATGHRLMFMGHIHRWIVAGPGRLFDWDAASPFDYDPAGRHLTVVHAVADGWAALLDTASNRLTPVPLEGVRRRPFTDSSQAAGGDGGACDRD